MLQSANVTDPAPSATWAFATRTTGSAPARPTWAAPGFATSVWTVSSASTEPTPWVASD